ncbi:glycosyltransferase family 4 protein, partial [Halorubrum tibetense]
VSGRHSPSGRDGRSDRSGSDAPEWRLTVVGNRGVAPAHTERLVERTASLGLDNRVEFVGELPDDDLVSTFDRSHVCCVPARYEAFGMVHLEAMEHGVVPIAGSLGGTGEFLRDGTNGFLVDPTADRTIADRIRRLATDRDRLAALGVAGLRTAERHPDWDETTDRIRTFLRSVVEGATGDEYGSADTVGGDTA